MVIESAESAYLETIRQPVDPIQAHIIPEHVTLCRENEPRAHAQTEYFFAANDCALLSLSFGTPQSFATHGLLLSSTDDTQALHAYRQRVLKTPAIANLSLHITLAHSRHARRIAAAAFKRIQQPGGLCREAVN